MSCKWYFINISKMDHSVHRSRVRKKSFSKQRNQIGLFFTWLWYSVNFFNVNLAIKNEFCKNQQWKSTFHKFFIAPCFSDNRQTMWWKSLRLSFFSSKTSRRSCFNVWQWTWCWLCHYVSNGKYFGAVYAPIWAFVNWLQWQINFVRRSTRHWKPQGKCCLLFLTCGDSRQLK